MPTFKNVFGGQNTNTDPQRSDLFWVSLQIPSILAGNSGVNLWDSEVGFAVRDFPFPNRDREMIPIKFLNQTNHIIGADSASGGIDMNVRYVFNRQTAAILERWHQLTSNPRTGGVALTSQVKTSGQFYWLVPNMAVQSDVDIVNPAAVTANTFNKIRAYKLEGILVKGLKPSNADMSTGNNTVELTFSLQIDRYYPQAIDDLTYNLPL